MNVDFPEIFVSHPPFFFFEPLFSLLFPLVLFFAFFSFLFFFSSECSLRKKKKRKKEEKRKRDEIYQVVKKKKKTGMKKNQKGISISPLLWEHASPISKLMFMPPNKKGTDLSSLSVNQEEERAYCFQTTDPVPALWMFPFPVRITENQKEEQQQDVQVKGLFVFFHGIASQITSHLSFMFKLAQKTQRIVVCPEYWGYFTSQEISFSTHTQPLTYLVLNHLKVQLSWIWHCFGQTADIEKHTTFFGHSLGAHFALALAVEQSNLESVILLTPFCRLKNFLRHYVGKWANLFVSFLEERMDNCHLASLLKHPVLICTGGLDTVSPVEMSQRIFQSCYLSSNRKWVMFPTFRHEVCLSKDFATFEPLWDYWLNKGGSLGTKVAKEKEYLSSFSFPSLFQTLSQTPQRIEKWQPYTLFRETIQMENEQLSLWFAVMLGLLCVFLVWIIFCIVFYIVRKKRISATRQTKSKKV